MSRIVFLSPVGMIGGAERLLLDVFASLREEAPWLELRLLSASEGPLMDRAAELGVDVTLLKMPEALSSLGDSAVREGSALPALIRMLRGVGSDGREAFRYLSDLRQWLMGCGPSLIHSNGIKTHLLASLVRPEAWPMIWHVHDFLGERRVVRRVLKLVRARVALVITNSKAVSEDVRRVLPAVPLRVIHNAVDLGEFKDGVGDGATLDALAGLPPPEGPVLRVGLIATFARWKGQEVFLRAAGRLLAKTPDSPVRFYVIGGPIYRTTDSQYDRQELVDLADELGLAERAGFIGYQAKPADVYRALDLVVHASTRPEPFGLTIAEAMACGRPALVSAAGGARELFTHGVDAWGFTPGDVVELSEAIRRLMDDAALRARLATRARQTAEERFDRSRLGREILAAYQAIASRGLEAEPTPGAPPRYLA